MSSLLESYVRKTKEIDIGGKKLIFSQLSLADFGLIKGRLRKQMKIEVEDKKEKLIILAQRVGDIDPMKLLEKLEVEPSDDDVFAKMEEVQHLAYAAFLSLRYKYSDITEDEVGKLLTLENMEEIVGILFIPDEEKKTKLKRRAGKVKTD